MSAVSILLASASPRRRQMLGWAGWPFEVTSADIDESPLQSEPPAEYVLRVAQDKAQAVAQRHPTQTFILAADTTVADGTALLGKPASADEAESMLRRLRGRTHQVYTALSIYETATGRTVTDVCTSQVPMRDYTEAEIAAYIATGDPLDKAGAYAIQHAGFHPVERFAGCFASVMGMPLCHLARSLRRLDVSAPQDVAATCQAQLNYICPIHAAVSRIRMWGNGKATMKIVYWLIVISMVLSACTAGASVTPAATSTTAGPLPTAQVIVTHAPDAQAAARFFLDGWVEEDFNKMYDAMTRVSRDAITREKFIARFQDVAINLTLQKLEYEVLSALLNPTTAQVAFRVTYSTALIGKLQRENLMNMTLEDGAWLVQWDDGLIMPELRGGNRLVIDYQIPARGNIFDNEGKAIVAQADAIALGIVPGEIDSKQEAVLVDQLSRLTGKTRQSIKELYKNAGPTWYIAVGEASKQAVSERMATLSTLSGLRMTDFSARYYFDGGVGPHLVGYVQLIPKERLEEFRRNGYRGDEQVGMQGIEKWGESYLSGRRGYSLVLVDPAGKPLTRLSQVERRPAQNIYTTINRNLQLKAQTAIEGFRGAIVVLERDTGRVLAMVSTPDLNPNLFEPKNVNYQTALGPMLSNPDNPLLNRAAQTSYPLGSVFKIITMAAALESGLYTAESTYECGYEFKELPGVTLYDWTKEKEQPPSGHLTLPEGLMRSCNPYFYHIGLDLFRQKGSQAITKIARGFGLGSVTGIGQVAENPGSMIDPANETESVQLAIGQSTMLVTPLQVAAFIAAVGNGGTLYRPQAVEKITTPDGEAVFTFKPEVTGKLPISDANLKIVQDAMRSVVENRRGTAFYALTGLGVPVYGKTGTAQSSTGTPHAWFAGYTDARRPDKPDIAVVVLAENAGEGSEISAPIFRRVLEVYYNGNWQTLYRWETEFNVTRTPAPKATPKP